MFASANVILKIKIGQCFLLKKIVRSYGRLRRYCLCYVEEVHY